MAVIQQDDTRRLHLYQSAKGSLVPVTLHAVFLGGTDQVARLTAVARYARVDADLFHRDMAAVIHDEHSKRSGSAFSRFHL